jgi:hypothetical protein
MNSCALWAVLPPPPVEAFLAHTQSENTSLFRGYALMPRTGLLGVEVEDAPIPGARFRRIAGRTVQPSPGEKRRIEGRTHPQGPPPVSGISGALIKNARRSDVADEDKRVAARQELRDLSG